jgi:arylsulfatase A-like enzyme
LDNVLIVLTADHGEDFGERGQFLHGSNLYGGLLHVPLIIKMPQQTENVSVSSLVRAIDIAPTILDFAGIAVPPQFHGSSMLDVPGRDDGTRSERWSFAETLEYGLQYPYDGYAFSYTSAKYKYICAPLEAQEQLYDLETDPHERLNIAGANRETVLKIREDIKDYFGLENVRELIPLHKPEIGEKQLKMLRTLGYVN